MTKKGRREEGINWTAVDVIGETDPRNTQLDIDTHLQRLPAEARPLKALLSSPAAEALIAEQSEATKKARTIKRKYLLFGRLAVATTAIGVLIGIAWALDQSLDDFAGTDWKQLFVLEAIVAAIGFGLSTYITSGGFFGEWMRHRTTAEQARRAFFDFVCMNPPLKDFDPSDRFKVDLLPLQLEYFRRYQLDLQYNYFRIEGRRKKRRNRKYFYLLWVLSITTLLVINHFGLSDGKDDKILYVFDAKTILNSGSMNISQIVWVGIALSLPFLQNMITDLRSLGDTSKDAKRNALMVKNLEAYRSKLTAIRKAAAAGDRTTVHAFIRDVNNLVALEHAEWFEVRVNAEQPDFSAMSRRFESRLPPQAKQVVKMARLVRHKVHDLRDGRLGV